MRRSYSVRRVMRHQRKPAELLLIPMIDIFTVLVTFLLMTAVFSRTVILELKLPPANSAPTYYRSVIATPARSRPFPTRTAPMTTRACRSTCSW
jgi:biopolymer transport protein ExbD